MKVFYEDGCSFHATAKYKGGLAPGQVHGALKWADQLAERDSTNRRKRSGATGPD